MTDETRGLADELVVAEAEERIEQRLVELDRAEADGRLRDAVETVPPVEKQLRPILEARQRQRRA